MARVTDPLSLCLCPVLLLNRCATSCYYVLAAISNRYTMCMRVHPMLTLRIPDELSAELRRIAAVEERSLTAQAIRFLRIGINAWHAERGTVSPLDITPDATPDHTRTHVLGDSKGGDQ